MQDPTYIAGTISNILWVFSVPAVNCSIVFTNRDTYGFNEEKEMAIHSSILAWEIPWTEEPGGLQSMGSQRVGHD